MEIHHSKTSSHSSLFIMVDWHIIDTSSLMMREMFISVGIHFSDDNRPTSPSINYAINDHVCTEFLVVCQLSVKSGHSL